MSVDAPTLPPEWLDAAHAAARNLGLGKELPDLSPEHWQRVLANVSARMTMLEIEEPEGWRESLAVQAGRSDPASLSQNVIDAKLAARGEVFSRDDDA